VLYADGTIGFRVGAHDPRATLVIDPSISIAYTTFLGGTGSDTASSMAIDASGNTYIGGTTTNAATFPEATTAVEGPGGGSADFFIAKIDPTKSGADSLVYLTFLGGSGEEAGGLVAVDSKGDVALTGTTTSSDYPVTDKSTLTSGTNDAVVSEVSPAGDSLNFSTIFGGNGAEDAQSTGGIALDSSGNVFVAGDTSSTNLPVSAGAFQPNYGGGTTDGFLAKFTPSAGGATVTLAYCTYLGIDATAGVSGVALDASAATNVYLSGFTTNPVNSFPARNAFQPTYAGDPQDAFVMKISPLGKGPADLVYATLLGGSGMDEAFAIAVDDSTPPKAYVTGTTASKDFPIAGTVEAYQASLTQGAQANAFLAVISQNATTGMTSLAYSSYLGGVYTDSGNAIFLTAPNAVYISGSTTSFDFPWHDNLEPYNGAADAFVAKMDPTSPGNASLIYSTPLGGISPPGAPVTASAAGVVAATGAGGVVHVYVSGQTTAAGFPSGGATGGGFQVICSSCQQAPPEPDAFLVEIAEGASSLPSVYFNAANLNFGTQALGSTSIPPQGAAIYNGGETPLQISAFGIAGPNAGDFSLINAGQCANATIQPGQFCSFGVGFVPSIVGPEAATVVFTDNAPGSPQSLELIGGGAGPLASASPASINFGNQPQGSTSAGQVVTMTNTGNQPLAMSAVKVTGANVNEFPVTSSLGCTEGQSVPAGGSCTVTVSFAPASQGPASAQIEFDDNSGGVSGSEQIVMLTGTGTQPSPLASFTPTSLTFGTQTVGTTSAPQTVTLKNAGSAGLNVSSIGVTGANASSFGIVAQGANPCPTGSSTLAIGATCTIAVTYQPAAAGNSTASLSFTDDAPASPQTVALSGNSIEPAIQVSPTGLAFASQSVGTSSAAQAITVTNSGSSTLTINGVSVVGADEGDFKESDNCAGKSLGAAANCQANVTFSPAATGSRSATVNISDNAAGSPQTVALNGTATQAGIQISPGSVSFGNQAVQTTSSPVAITATNNGTGALQFSAVSIAGTNAADFAVSSDACLGANVSVAVNANCSMNVTFTPACVNSSGPVSATLVLANNAPGSPQNITLTGTPAGNYCVTGVAPQSVLAGATASYSLEASAVNAYVGSVTLSISGCPPNATCSAPASVSVAGNAQTPFTVNVATSAGNAAAAPRTWLVPFALLAIFAPAFATKKRSVRRALAMACFAGTLAFALAACGASNGGGGTGGDPGTPPGTYPMVLAGTANGTQQSLTLNLTVNP
jgi:hypothetical protein